MLLTCSNFSGGPPEHMAGALSMSIPFNGFCSSWVRRVAQWIEWRCVREVMGSIPVGDSEILCHTLVSCWSIHLSSPSLFTYDYLRWLWQCWPEQNTGRLSDMNSVKWPCFPWPLIAQGTERQPCVRKVMSWIPVRDTVFLCRTLDSCWSIHLSHLNVVSSTLLHNKATLLRVSLEGMTRRIITRVWCPLRFKENWKILCLRHFWQIDQSASDLGYKGHHILS